MNKKYAIVISNETTVYFGIRRNIGRDNVEVRNAITNFTSLLDSNVWSKKQMTISADCCEFWAHKKTTPGLQTLAFPIIHSDEFPMTIVIAGKNIRIYFSLFCFLCYV